MIKNRYEKQTKLSEVGTVGQDKLHNAKVLVVGAGGLGCAVVPYLAAAGVGKIGIIDNDTIELSNLQRQVLYDEAAVGRTKVEVAKEKLSNLNSTIEIEAIKSFLVPKNAIDLLQQYDIVVDATDNIKTRLLINDVCLIVNKPFVYGSVYKFEGQVAVFNYEGGATYSCVFNETSKQDYQNCDDTGVLGVNVAIIGQLQSNEVLKMILGTGEVLKNKILIYNSLKNEMNTFSVEKKAINPLTKDQFETKYNLGENEITSQEVLEKLKNKTAILLDVRESYEEPELDFVPSTQISLYELRDNLDQLKTDKEIIIICQTGNRSEIAKQVLDENGFDNVTNFGLGAIKFVAEVS